MNSTIDTTTNLEEQLKSLKSTLLELESEEEGLILEQQEFIQAIENKVSTIKVTDDKETIDDYIKRDKILCDNVQSQLDHWKQLFESRLDQEASAGKKIKKLVHEYRYTEFDVIDLTAQIEGYQARIRSLNHETLRLNALPHILPILKSETENYKAEMQKTTKLLEKLEQESIKPSLIELSELKIAAPLIQDQFEKAIEYAELLKRDLVKIIDVLIKQRAIQTFISCIDQIKNEAIPNSDSLENIVATINSLFLKDTKETEISTDNTQSQLTEKLLDDFLESKDNTLYNRDMIMADKIHALKKYQLKLKNRWSQDFDSCLDAITELDGLRIRLSDTLFVHSHSTDELVLTPESYTTLQAELESRIDELTERMSVLQNEIEDPDQNALFKKRVKLFSAYYTDPIDFLDLIEKEHNK
ncbi:hypothetical protein INT48_000098 [Thamnidium elegans]|uniref:Uncharacterized protein n=1 Tax=Thamnidium elegans TaxID=101142 RepID=A0A8H7SQ31_9FUNG|nr:hypothetical protein INT48_000098 [Thamnidium elegans]